MASLFTRHPMVLQTAFSELKRQASEQPRLFVGSAGSVGVRDVKGRKFYYRQFYDPLGAKGAEYIGAVADPEAEAAADALRERITVATALAEETRILAQRGYARADARTGAVLAAAANHGLFRGGAVLVGSHAYGALLNELGARAAAFATEDIDIARGSRLELEAGRSDIVAILADSRVSFVPVPSLDRKAPPTSYKVSGRDRLRVDLLAPTGGSEISTKPVPELAAHATALPLFATLLEDPIEAVVLSRGAVVPVRVPRPEALAWHKMMLADLRGNARDKRGKDLQQASVLFAILAEDAPAALEDGLRALSPRARNRLVPGAEQVLGALRAAHQERAATFLSELVPRATRA